MRLKKGPIVVVLIVIISIITFITVTNKSDKVVVDNSNNKEEKDLDVKSNSNSNDTSNSNSNVVSNSNSNITSNKVSNSNKASNKSSNKNSNVTSNKTSNSTKTSSSDVVGKTSKGYNIKKIDGIYYVNGILVANKSYDLPSSYAPGGLLSEFNIAFTKMKEDASKEGVNLKIVSGYRSYSRQKTLYNNYVSRDGKKEADTYSARPGHSEHQTGLAADLNLVDTSFENTKEGKWLANNCYKYGFILRYPKGKESITGYIYEPWHFRFIGDEAKNLYNNGTWISLEEYLGIDSEYKY